MHDALLMRRTSRFFSSRREVGKAVSLAALFHHAEIKTKGDLL